MRSKADKPLHSRLRLFLRGEWQAGHCTQESLARAVGKTQTNVGQYLLLNDKKSGPLDLDEAADALRHVGSDLPKFLAGYIPTPPTRAELLGRQLEDRDDVIELVEALLAVPRQRLPVVRGLIESGYFAATGRRLAPRGGSVSGNAPAARTTKARARRRQARERRKQTDDE
jgi:hypothetical protein